MNTLRAACPTLRCLAPTVQSVGRSEESATCKSYVGDVSSCSASSSPLLALAPSTATKWLFVPAGGGIQRFYIRMQVRGNDRHCRLRLTEDR